MTVAISVRSDPGPKTVHGLTAQRAMLRLHDHRMRGRLCLGSDASTIYLPSNAYDTHMTNQGTLNSTVTLSDSEIGEPRIGNKLESCWNMVNLSVVTLASEIGLVKHLVILAMGNMLAQHKAHDRKSDSAKYADM